MLKKKILEHITPNLLREIIFNYVQDNNLILKIFSYSKFYQEILNIQLIDYQVSYIDQLGINLDDYLTFEINNKEKALKMKSKFENILIKNNIDIDKIDVQKFTIKLFKKIYKKKIQFYNDKIDKNKLYIDIYSPFFEALSKDKLFENFTIKINIKDIEDFNLKNDYISIFAQMNKSKINYSSIFFKFKNNENINYLKDFNINFGQIQKLSCAQDYCPKKENFNNFFKILFSFNNIGNNLMYLDLELYNDRLDSDRVNIDANSFENLNNFKSLKDLRLHGLLFKTYLNINLINLQHLYISSCSMIIFTDECNLNLKSLFLLSNTDVKPKNILNLPNISECFLKSAFNFKENFRTMIDFSSLKKIKSLKAEPNDFLLIENNNILKSIDLYSLHNISKSNELKLVEKILSMKSLENVSLSLNTIDIDDILKIPGENSSILSIKIVISNKNKHLYFNKIQNKFPNVSELSFEIFNNSNGMKLEINQNPNSKVNKLYLSGYGQKEIKIDIQSFEKLKIINIDADIINLKEALPFFNKNYQIKYNSLTIFNFLIHGKKELSIELLNNLYNNIDNMPNLKEFYLHLYIKDINEAFYKQIIRKLLSLKLNVFL